ncbi:MAG: hypothetical protein JRI75_10085 [Deltaproteobacteria bacterium]|nr:hypothetical protein [Deltaproteobacteria bacterium]
MAPHMKKTTLFCFVCLFVNACAGMPMSGKIHESTSKFDGSRQLIMEPEPVHGTSMMLSLFKNTNMPEDIIVLKVFVSVVENFSEGAALHFIIDGDAYRFVPTSRVTNFTSWSYMDFTITKAFLKKLIDAEKVIIKVSSGEKKYTEGEFSKDDVETARPAFRTFYSKLATF